MDFWDRGRISSWNVKNFWSEIYVVWVSIDGIWLYGYGWGCYWFYVIKYYWYVCYFKVLGVMVWFINDKSWVSGNVWRGFVYFVW